MRVTLVTVDVREIRDRSVVCEICGREYTQFVRAMCKREDSMLSRGAATALARTEAQRQLALSGAFPHRCTHCGRYSPSHIQQIRDAYDEYCRLGKAGAYGDGLRKMPLTEESYEAELDRANAPEVADLWLSRWQVVGKKHLDRVLRDDEEWRADRSLGPGHAKRYSWLLKALHKFDPWWPRQHGLSLQGDVGRNYYQQSLLTYGMIFIIVLFLAMVPVLSVVVSTLGAKEPTWALGALVFAIWFGASITITALIAPLVYYREPFLRVLKMAKAVAPPDAE
jgi:hypothetical protein